MVALSAFIDRQFIHWPASPTASFNGQTVIVTGSNTGLGLAAARSITERGASKVILACRNVEKGKLAAQSIIESTSCPPETVEVWPLDNGSYASVLAFGDRVKAELPRLDALLLNAGIGTRTFRMTEDNEETITTNVVSLALLAFMLHSKLAETAKSFNTTTHMSITASELYEDAKFKESQVPTGQIFATLSDAKKANMGDRYNVSKLMNIFLAKQMAVMFPIDSFKVAINCVAPGHVIPSCHSMEALLTVYVHRFCQSELAREYLGTPGVKTLIKVLARPTEVGARTLVNGASAGPESHGQYLPDCKITETKGLTKGKDGAELQKRVWEEMKSKLERIRPGVTSLA